MTNSKRKYVKKPFESRGNSSDTSANIYESMLTSAIWQSLTHGQKDLYLVCKAQYYAEKKKPQGNQEYFTMNQDKWMNKYRLYSAGNKAQFYKDMDALITKGFVKLVESGRNTRTKNVYAFSGMWLLYEREIAERSP